MRKSAATPPTDDSIQATIPSHPHLKLVRAPGPVPKRSKQQHTAPEQMEAEAEFDDMWDNVPV